MSVNWMFPVTECPLIECLLYLYVLVSHSRHRVPMTDFPTKFSLTKFGNDGGATAGATSTTFPFEIVPFCEVALPLAIGLTLARRLLLEEERKVDLPLFFLAFLSLEGSDLSGMLPFLFSSLASEIANKKVKTAPTNRQWQLL